MRIRDTGHDGKVSVAGRINVYIRGEHGAAAFVDGGDTLNFPLLLMQVCQKGVQQERDAFFLPHHLKIDLLEDFRLNGRNGFRDAERIGNMTEGTAAMRKTVHDFLREAPDHLMDAGMKAHQGTDQALGVRAAQHAAFFHEQDLFSRARGRDGCADAGCAGTGDENVMIFHVQSSSSGSTSALTSKVLAQGRDTV